MSAKLFTPETIGNYTGRAQAAMSIVGGIRETLMRQSNALAGRVSEEDARRAAEIAGAAIEAHAAILRLVALCYEASPVGAEERAA